MNPQIDSYLQEFEKQKAANPKIDDLRFLTWLQCQLLIENNSKLDRLLALQSDKSGL